jgi:hypothetical protein
VQSDSATGFALFSVFMCWQVCSGESGQCPDDLFAAAGSGCSDGAGGACTYSFCDRYVGSLFGLCSCALVCWLGLGCDSIVFAPAGSGCSDGAGGERVFVVWRLTRYPNSVDLFPVPCICVRQLSALPVACNVLLLFTTLPASH